MSFESTMMSYLLQRLARWIFGLFQSTPKSRKPRTRFVFDSTIEELDEKRG